MIKNVPYYIRLIRPVNLCIIFFTQLIFVLKATDFQLSSIILPDFFLIVSSIIFTTAAGYVVNDLFDIEIDKINKPLKQFIPKPISFKAAKIFYFVLVSLSLILAFLFGRSFLAMVIAVNILLYFYSQDLKKSVLFGNLLVSFLSGMVVFTTTYACFNNANTFYALYSLLAFLMTMSREIIKDVQDMDGDEAHGAKTLPIVYGVRASKWAASICTALLVIVLLFIAFKTNKMPYWLSIGALLGWFIFTAQQMWLATKSSEYGKVSLLLKVGIFAGISSVLLV
mgnify:CR=1 FL=1